jgi:DNA-binding transcriptional LysR family regulator
VDWNDLRYLLAVHRRGSVAGAAKELRVQKSTASRRLAALERALDAKLFERNARGLELTAAGRAVVDAAAQMADIATTLADRVHAATESSPRGVVRLTAPHWLAERIFIPALPELQSRYPELEVELTGTNKLLNLAAREADLAIRNVRPTQKSLRCRKIFELGGCVYASSVYLDTRGTPRSRRDLDRHDVLVYETLDGMPGFEWLKATKARVAFRANDPMALVGAATAGLGLAAVPSLLGDAEPALRRVESLGFSRCDIYLITPEAVRATARVRAVSDFVVEVVQRNLPRLEG